MVLPDLEGRRETGHSIVRVLTPFFSVIETFIVFSLEGEGSRVIEKDITLDRHTERELYGFKFTQHNIAKLRAIKAQITVAEETPIAILLLVTFADVPSASTHGVEELDHPLLVCQGDAFGSVESGEGFFDFISEELHRGHYTRVRVRCQGES
tara:strand:- start:113 stop:571 length:459 start_codon:yes stop_codon:yes gene_type:complete